MSIKLTQPRRDLLERLVKQDGKLRGALLSVPHRRLASMMTYDGLVKWDAPAGVRGLDNWSLKITEAGRAALRGHT